MTSSSTPHTSESPRSHETLGALHVLGIVEVDKALDDERLEHVEGHRLRQTALVHAQGRTDHDHGTAGIIHTLTEQVLTETTPAYP